MESCYVEWLKTQAIPLFESNGIYWRLYNGALVPASPAPHFLKVPDGQAKDLLHRSRAWFLRYTSDPTTVETPWWYIVCDSQDLKKLSSKLRNQIRYAIRSCSVQRIDASWLGEHGYAVYLAAHQRYMNAAPLSQDTYRANVTATVGGPIDYWGVFVGQQLAGYCQCNLERNNVDISVMRFDPAYLKSYTAYAMISYLIDHYVNEGNTPLSNGERSVAHQTNFQHFLLKFGFTKRFCRLNVIYQPWLRSAMQAVFPFRRALTRCPDRGVLHKFRALLFQEEIRRLCG